MVYRDDTGGETMGGEGETTLHSFHHRSSGFELEENDSRRRRIRPRNDSWQEMR